MSRYALYRAYPYSEPDVQFSCIWLPIPVNRVRYKTRSTVAGKETFEFYGTDENKNRRTVNNTVIDGQKVHEIIMAYANGEDYISYPSGKHTDYNNIRAIDTSTNTPINGDFIELMKSYSKDKVMEKLLELQKDFNK